MDTIFYMCGVNKNDPAVMALDVFKYFSRFTKAMFEGSIKDRIKDGSFDDHQKLALTESAKWLTNSLHPSLISSLHSELKKNPTGPVLWMAIVSEVRSNSVRIVRESTDKFYAVQASDFPGEKLISWNSWKLKGVPNYDVDKVVRYHYYVLGHGLQGPLDVAPSQN